LLVLLEQSKIKDVCERLQKEQIELAKDIEAELDQEMKLREGLGYKRRNAED